VAEGSITAPSTAVESARAHAERSPEVTRSRNLVWQDPVATALAAASRSGREFLEAIASGEIPPPPIAVLMRIQPVEIGDGRVVFEGEPGEDHYNPIGVVHGGYAATILDSALGCAAQTTLPAGSGYTTLSLEIKYVRGISHETGPVRAEAEVVHRGRKQMVAEAKLTAAEGGKLLATATSTLLVLGPEG
jgi:uncharacterized protein (TIGR00369 family)